jgi:hypothetical protein
MEEAQHLIKFQKKEQPVVLKNPFPQGKNMQVVSSTSNLQRGTFGASFLDESFSFTNIVNYSKLKEEEVYFLTRYCDYSNPDSTKKGKETSYP